MHNAFNSLPSISPLQTASTAAGDAARSSRDWLVWAVGVLSAEQSRSADTHLIPVPLANAPGIALYLKDESSHPTGSLKHRLARSMFLYALCNGWIGPETTVIEASSGSTAVSEAYFARLLGLRYIAVVPAATACEKIALIEEQGGQCHKVEDPRTIYAEAERLAAQCGGHYLDQFTYAERATDWRGTNSIAMSIFQQMQGEEHPVPRWIVCGAGTGGTSATIGRYLRYGRHKTGLCVADPAGSVFHRHFEDRAVQAVDGFVSLVEGIGRPRVEPSFLPGVVDRMIAVPDASSFRAARHLSRYLGRSCGPSTGTNLHACLDLIEEMAAAGEKGSIVTLLCDCGDRYRSTCYNEAWLEEKGMAAEPCDPRLGRYLPLAG